MEYQLWLSIIAVLASLDKPHSAARLDFSDEDIVKVFFWCVIHDRPVLWACQSRNWPLHCRRRALPSPPTMCRRLQQASVLALLGALETRVIAPQEPGIFWMIDGKPLVIGGASKDRQAGYGRAVRGKAKGYKIHAIVDPAGSIAAWRLAPMNKDERVMAERLLRVTPLQGYLVADANYDSNPLHALCDQNGQLQLVTPRRSGPKHGLGHRQHAAGRLRSIALTENPNPAFAEQLLLDRNEIERRFAELTNWGGGLTCLPPWVRTYRRVHRWVQAKLVLTALKRALQITTYAA
jgi:hypothetical protein